MLAAPRRNARGQTARSSQPRRSLSGEHTERRTAGGQRTFPTPPADTHRRDRERRGTDPAHPTDWVDPVKLQQQAAAWKQAGVPDHEIAARNFEAVLASVKQSRQMLLPHHRTYEPGTSKEEQDALMDETLAIYDRVLEQLPVLIRRMRMRVVDE